MLPDPAVESMRLSLLFTREYSGLPLLCNCGNAVMGSLSHVLQYIWQELCAAIFGSCVHALVTAEVGGGWPYTAALP